jgi:hypothetical protein
LAKHARYALIAGRQCAPVENLQGILVLTVADMLSMEQVFEPEAFNREDVCLPKNGTLRVIASDGACWATVVGFTPLGNVILVPDGQEIEQPAAVKAAARRRAA